MYTVTGHVRFNKEKHYTLSPRPYAVPILIFYIWLSWLYKMNSTNHCETFSTPSLHILVTVGSKYSSLLGPNIRLRILFSNTLRLVSSLKYEAIFHGSSIHHLYIMWFISSLFSITLVHRLMYDIRTGFIVNMSSFESFPLLSKPNPHSSAPNYDKRQFIQKIRQIKSGCNLSISAVYEQIISRFL